MRLQDIAQHQQNLVGKQNKGASALGFRNPPPIPSRQLEQGKYSDKSQPIDAPWNRMPDGGFPFSQPGVINTPAIGAGFTDVIAMQVPNGYDGVIKRLKNTYNGQGFTNGSGQLIWRLLINRQAVRGYDSILVEYGDDAVTGTTDGIRFTGGTLVEFQVENISLITSGTQVMCFLGGWFYPNKIMGR